MTKRRPPMTFARALTRVADLIGWDGCAQLLNCSENWVRKLSDPDAEREISLQKARRLDLAYMRAGGDGAPFGECYMLQIETEGGASRSSADDLIAASGAAAKEAGEAVAASLLAIQNFHCPARRQDALREIEESVEAFKGLAQRICGGAHEQAH